MVILTGSYRSVFAATTFLLGSGAAVRLQGQTFVQIPELSPEHIVGPRITQTVAMSKLNRRLFAALTAKTTFIDALLSPPRAYEFSTDAVWNRVLFGEKDEYIYPFTNAGSSTIRLLGPSGVDISATRTLFIADRVNGRVVLVRFNAATKSLSQIAVTQGDPDLDGVVDVAWDGGSTPLTIENFYALDEAGRVSFWTWSGSGAPAKAWVMGAYGTAIGQFNGPTGICVGHALGSSGGSVFTSDFYVADRWNKRIVQLRQSHPPLAPTWVRSMALPDGGVPADCTVDHFGNVIVADSRNSRLLKYTSNLEFLSQYGSYGVGAADNTFANPNAVHVPFGIKRTPSGQTIWYGEGRVLTAEDWGAQSGAREHYLGIDGVITAQPQAGTNGDAWFSYRTTDHGTHMLNIVDVSGNYVRTIPPAGLLPPGTRTAYWDGFRDNGTPAATGTYRFQVSATSGYGCTGGSWCAKGMSSQSFFHEAGGGCGGPCSPPVAKEAVGVAPEVFFLRQHIVSEARPLARTSSSAGSGPVSSATAPTGSLHQLVRQFGVRGLTFGVPGGATTTPVSIRVYSLAGRPIRTLVDQPLSAGFYEVGWDGLDDRGRPVGSGVYTAVLVAGTQRLTQRLILRSSQ